MLNDEQPLFQRCLKPLLKQMEWHGTERELAESFPHFKPITTASEFRWSMQYLGYKSEKISIYLYHLDTRLLPCLFIPSDGSAPKVLVEAVGEGISVYYI